MKRCIVALLVLALSACAGSNSEFAKGSGKTLAIDKGAWAAYQEYLGLVGNTRPGAFVVSVDGYSSAWTWCSDIQCRTTSGYANEALANCRRSFAMDCVVFARNSEIVVNYEVVE